MAVKRAVALLHSHTITSRVGKGEPGEDGAQDGRWWELVQGVSELPHPRGLPEAVAAGKFPPSLPWFPHLKNGGVGPGGGLLSPVLIFCKSL